MSSIEKPSAGRTIAGWAILAFPLLLFILLFVNPIVHNLILSLQKWNGLRSPEFVGLSNYEHILGDARFLAALGNTLFSPGLLLRALFLTVGPLALALLLMELRSGARAGLHLLLAPLVLFSGALVVLAAYYIYYSPAGGLAQLLTPSPGGGPVLFFAEPERALAVLGNLLLANGLAYALPFGTAYFLCAARGARAVSPDAFSFGVFWSRAGRLVAAFAIGALGFSIAGLEGAILFPAPMHAGENVVTYSYDNSFRMFNFGPGSAAIQFVALPLLLLGLVFILVIERKRAPLSIAVTPRTREKITASARLSGGRIAAVIASCVVAAAVAAALVVVVVLPWIGSLAGLAGQGGGRPVDLGAGFIQGLVISLVTALASSLVCWGITAAAGFALGYLRPKGSRWLLKVIGTFVFIGPAFFLVPYFLTFKNLHLVGTVLPLIIPSLVSPAGILLFTWFFRGMRDEKTAREAGDAAGSGRVGGPFLLFSLPVIALYLLLSLNMALLPITMIMDSRSFTAPLYLMRVLNEGLMAGTAPLAEVVQLSFFVYLIPLALLVVSAVVVFPRLALVVRRKGEAAPALDQPGVDKLTR